MIDHAPPAQVSKADLYGNQSARPVMLAPVWDGIPAALRSLPQWIGWELRWLPKRATWAKVPIDVRGYSLTDGYPKAKSDTPATWTTCERVRAAWGRTFGTATPADPDGPGFVFRAGGGLVGIDVDKCRDRTTGELSEFGRAMVARFRGYWEASPSGTGIKGVFFGEVAGGKGRRLDYPEGHGVELYDRGRYFAITGRAIEGATPDVTDAREAISAFVAEIDAAKLERAAHKRPPRARVSAPAPDRPADSSPSARTYDVSDRLRRAALYLDRVEPAVAGQGGDNRTFRTACILVLGFDLTPAAALPLMRAWNDTCLPPWNEDWLWRKLTQADQQPGDRGHLLNAPLPDRGPIGYEGMSPDEVDALFGLLGRSVAHDIQASQPVTPAAPPEACAIFAARDVSEEIAASWKKCPNTYAMILRKGEAGCPFVCDRPCGNGTKCEACLNRRLYEKVRASKSYMVRTSAQGDTSGTTTPRVVYAALLPADLAPGTARWGTLTKRIAEMAGERASVLTDDATGVSGTLGRDPIASGFFLEDNQVEEESRCRLWLLSLPGSAAPAEVVSVTGCTFRRVPTANAIHALFRAVQSVPPPEGDNRYKPYHESDEWGDDEPQEPSDVQVVRPSKYGRSAALKLFRAAEVECYDVPFDPRGGCGPGLGWRLSGARSLAVELWLGGVDSPSFPTISRLIELARHWLPILPADLGSGHRVQAVLRQHIWSCALYDITADLRAADAQDRQEAAFHAEAASLYQQLREQYRGREHEATGILAELLA